MYFQIALIETPRDSYIIRIQLGLHNGNNARSLKLFRLSFKLDAVIAFRIGIGICKGGYIPRKPWHTCILYTRLCKSTLSAHYKPWILRVW